MIWRFVVVLASAAAFIRCLAQTAFVTNCCYMIGNTRGFSGLDMFVTGWMGVLGSWLHPLLFFSITGAWICSCIGSQSGFIVWAFVSFALIAGFPTLLSNAGYAAWLANPMIVATWFLYLGERRPAALTSSVFALGLILAFLSVGDVPLDDKLDPVEIVSYGTGYWLWMASAGVLAAGVSADTLLRHFIASETQSAPQD